MNETDGKPTIASRRVDPILRSLKAASDPNHNWTEHEHQSEVNSCEKCNATSDLDHGAVRALRILLEELQKSTRTLWTIYELAYIIEAVICGLDADA